MATKSFFKNIVIKNRKTADSFIRALENAENKGKKNVSINAKVETIKDKEKIKRIFGVN